MRPAERRAQHERNGKAGCEAGLARAENEFPPLTIVPGGLALKRAVSVAVCTALIIALALAVAAPLPAVAAPDISVTVDDLPIAFDVPLQRENDRVLVPFRAISEAIGVKVEWVQAERGIIATRPASADGPGIEVRLWIDRSAALVNGQEQPLDVPPRLVSDKTFIPARFFATAFGCDVNWDQSAQRVLITTPERTMTVYAFYALGNSKASSWTDLFGLPYPDADLATAHQRLLSGVGYGWYNIDGDGRLRADNPLPGWNKPPGWDNVLVMSDRAGLTDEMVVYASDSQGRIAALLGDERAVTALRAAIVSEAELYNGVNLDWEELGFGADAETQAGVRARYGEFVKSLGADLAAKGKTLTVTVPPGNSAFAAAYDYAKLGLAAERLVLMAYDYYDRALPSPPAPFPKVEEAVRMLLDQGIPAGKILLGIAPGGVEWRTQPTLSRANPLPASDVASLTARAALTWDAAAQANWFTYQDAAGNIYQVWLEDGCSVARKIALAKRYGLRGIALWRLGEVPPDVWEAVDRATRPERGAPAEVTPAAPPVSPQH